MRKGASVVWYLSLPLMNSFNKTEAAIFPMQAMLPEDFLFFLFELTKMLIWISVPFKDISSGKFLFKIKNRSKVN